MPLEVERTYNEYWKGIAENIRGLANLLERVDLDRIGPTAAKSLKDASEELNSAAWFVHFNREGEDD